MFIKNKMKEIFNGTYETPKNMFQRIKKNYK